MLKYKARVFTDQITPVLFAALDNLRALPYDVLVVCAYRGKAEQDKAYKEGKSKSKWGQSAHNINPSNAVDLAPFRKGSTMLEWNNKEHFREIRKIIESSVKLKPEISWDMGHYELEKED
jgi:hypothetical protein